MPKLDLHSSITLQGRGITTSTKKKHRIKKPPDNGRRVQESAGDHGNKGMSGTCEQPEHPIALPELMGLLQDPIAAPIPSLSTALLH